MAKVITFACTIAGQLMIWDISTGTLVRSFKNTIEGQGYGALFDAKWSPDGYTIATTDSHGHLILFGIGHNEKFKKVLLIFFFFLYHFCIRSVILNLLISTELVFIKIL